MLHATAYSHVKKWDPEKAVYREFTAERVVGLAVEAVHKLARDQKALITITKDDVQPVIVQYKVQVWNGSRWQNARACSLAVRPSEAEQAVAVAKRQRKFFADVNANIFWLDRYLEEPDLLLDMQVDFSIKNYLAELVSGHLWVELKAFGAVGFENSLEKETKRLKGALPHVMEAAPNITGVILLACKIQKQVAGGFAWAQPKLVVKLFTDGHWSDISPGGVSVGRGRCKTQKKPSLGEVWSAMTWYSLGDDDDDDEEQVGLLSGFLKKLGLKNGNVAKRAKTFNKALQASGCTGRIKQLSKRQCKQLGLPGGRPRVATQNTLRQVYKTL